MSQSVAILFGRPIFPIRVDIRPSEALVAWCGIAKIIHFVSATAKRVHDDNLQYIAPRRRHIDVHLITFLRLDNSGRDFRHHTSSHFSEQHRTKPFGPRSPVIDSMKNQRQLFAHGAFFPHASQMCRRTGFSHPCRFFIFLHPRWRGLAQTIRFQ
jgi:hypothetical protein